MEAKHWGILILLVAVFTGLVMWDRSVTAREQADAQAELATLTPRQAMADHFEDISNYIDGTVNGEACYDYDHCYTLEMELEDGIINYVYFPNGGYLQPDTDIDREGFAEFSEDRKDWEFNIDMDNDIVYSAITRWAEDNGYIINLNDPDPAEVARLEQEISSITDPEMTLQKALLTSDLHNLYQGDLD